MISNFLILIPYLKPVEQLNPLKYVTEISLYMLFSFLLFLLVVGVAYFIGLFSSSFVWGELPHGVCLF